MNLRRAFAQWLTEVIKEEPFASALALDYLESGTPKGALPQLVVDGALPESHASKEALVEALRVYVSLWYDRSALGDGDAEYLAQQLSARIHMKDVGGARVLFRERTTMLEDKSTDGRIRLSVVLHKG